MTTPFDLFSKNLTMWTETTLKAQQAWMKAAAHQTEQMMALPVFAPIADMMVPDETQIREGFQKAADMNLNAWTAMAEKVSALPSWARAPVEVPGRTLVDMFDMFRPFPTFVANPDAQAGPAAPIKAAIGLADDLTAIKGIGPKIADKLAALGVVSFSQIANWTEADIQQIDAALSLGERIVRQDWIAQAEALAKPVLH
jgi:hypothetical protein